MKGKKKKGNFIFNSVLALLLFAGVSLLLYPTFSNWWNASRQSQAISDYAGKVDEMDAEEYARLWREAREYNRALAEQSTRYALTEEQKERYEKLLNVSLTGSCLYRFRRRLPPAHLSRDQRIRAQIAAGHLEWSSLPVEERPLRNLAIGGFQEPNFSRTWIKNGRGRPVFYHSSEQTADL